MEKTRRLIGELNKDQFEDFSINAMAKVQGYEGIRSGLNYNSKTTKGTPDAYVELPNGNYVAFQFTSTKIGNIKSKLKKDINALSSEKCHFRDKIEKVVFCFACNMNSDIEVFKKLIAVQGWEYDFYPLDRLADLCIKDPDLMALLPNKEIALAEIEPLYDCGERIKEIREDIGLSESEFKELLHFFSVKEFVLIEKQEKEAPVSLLHKIAETTGAGLEWLKHGNEPKYPSSMVNSSYDRETLPNELEGKKIECAYYCLEPKDMRLALIIKFSEYRWKTIFFSFNLNFWEWIDDHSHIPLVLDLIRYSYNTLKRQNSYKWGRIITREVYRTLQSENIFLADMIGKIPHKQNENYWIEDLFEYQDLSGGRDEAYKDWYGDWFLKLHGYLVKYQKQ